MSLADIEKVIGDALPASAYRHAAWWANETGRHVQATAWLDAGFRVDEVDRATRTVTFRVSVDQSAPQTSRRTGRHR